MNGPQQIKLKRQNYYVKILRVKKRKRDWCEFEDTPIMSFPLRKNQFGYMNLSLQKFLGFDITFIILKKLLQ